PLRVRRLRPQRSGARPRAPRLARRVAGASRRRPRRLMEFVSILQVLGRHRLAIAIGCALALLLAISTVYRISPGGLQSRSHTAGTANAELLMAATDEPASDLRKRS